MTGVKGKFGGFSIDRSELHKGEWFKVFERVVA
jgi:hypothetical protein